MPEDTEDRDRESAPEGAVEGEPAEGASHEAGTETGDGEPSEGTASGPEAPGAGPEADEQAGGENQAETEGNGGETGAGSAEGAAETDRETEPPTRARAPRPGWLCTALHGKMSRVDYFSTPGGAGFPHRCKVILRTSRGTEMGTVVASPQEADLAALDSRPGQVLRAATTEDLERQKQIEESVEPTEKRECAEEIAKLELPMRLLAAEHIFGGEKIVFYFMSDGRVDFRKLVRDMARRYRTRIEFRQVGVRDEARLLAEYEHCGQPLCCRQFLRGLEPVTMRMAKLQKATLDPAKISGRCGRLMCCLRYEEEVYAELRSKLPSRGVYVLTDEIAGQVVSGDIISQRVVVNTGQRRVTVGVGDIRKLSRQPLEAPAPKIPAEPRQEAVSAVREASPGGRRRGSGRRSKGSEGQKDRGRRGGGKGGGKSSGKAEGAGESGGRESGGKRRGGRRRRGRSRGRRGRSGGKGGSGQGASGGNKGGNASGGPKA